MADDAPNQPPEDVDALADQFKATWETDDEETVASEAPKSDDAPTVALPPAGSKLITVSPKNETYA